jgi:hypothetical protein
MPLILDRGPCGKGVYAASGGRYVAKGLPQLRRRVDDWYVRKRSLRTRLHDRH